MGRMIFHVPRLDQYDPRIWNTAYVTGIEGVPWEGRVSVQGELLTIDRPIYESGRLSLVWPTAEFGLCTLHTASLRCNDQPYLLPLELARGTLHRVRGRAADWQRVGLKVPETYSNSINIATERFVDAMIAKETSVESSETLAQASIAAAMQAQRPLCRAFISQSIQYRQQQEKQLSTLLAAQLDPRAEWQADATLALPAMNTVIIAPTWHLVQADEKSIPLEVFDEQFQWATKEGLRVIAGPLISLQPWALQHWMNLMKDFDAVCNAACEYVRNIVSRYRGQASIWNVATGLNVLNDLGLSDEQHLKIAVEVIQAVRKTDPRTPVVMTIDMPWSEYLGQSGQAINPFPFADSLIRAELGLSGIALEINTNFWPGGSLPRDLIDVSDLIDHWSMLGVPLVALVNGPVCNGSDIGCVSKATEVFRWNAPSGVLTNHDEGSAAVNSPAAVPSNSHLAMNQIEIIQMLLAKQNVHAIGWTQMSDRLPHRFPNGGLIDGHGKSRPMLDGLAQIRKRYGE